MTSTLTGWSIGEFPEIRALLDYMNGLSPAFLEINLALRISMPIDAGLIANSLIASLISTQTSQESKAKGNPMMSFVSPEGDGVRILALGP